MEIAEASADELGAAWAVLVACRQALEAQGLRQWSPDYPSEAFFSAAIVERSLFLLRDASRVLGVVVLNQAQPAEWCRVAWRDRRRPFLVVHALAVRPQSQGRGCGRRLLRFCEDSAQARGYASLRLDAFSENLKSLVLYEHQGYRFRGEVRFSSKPPGHQRYRCYEKALVPGATAVPIPA